MDIYKLIRQKVKELKVSCGFECKMCGSCCTPNAGLSEEDFFYMNENGVNLEGIKIVKYSDGSLMPTDLKHKLNKYGGKTGICFYEEEKSEKTICRIHPNNPLVCQSFPFVVNLATKFFMIKDSCTWMRENFGGFSVKVKYVEEIKDLKILL